MANNCENTVRVTGPVAEVEKFIAEVVTEDMDGGKRLDAYEIRPYPEGQGDEENYNWCVENWGTEWSGYHGSESEYTVLPDGKAELILEFDTAWSPYSSELYEILSKRFPGLTIECRYVEYEMRFTGTITAKNGDLDEEYIDQMKPCHYGELKVQGGGVWLVRDKGDNAAVIEGPKEIVPVLDCLWAHDQYDQIGSDLFRWGDLPPLPEDVAARFGEEAIVFHCRFDGWQDYSEKDIQELHSRLAEIRRLVLNPTEAEALEFLAHAEADVRDYARKQWKDWRDTWGAEAFIKSTGPEIEKENAVIKKKPVRSRKPKR